MVYEYSSSPNLSTRPRLIYCLKQIYPEDVVEPCSCRRGRSKTFCHAPSRQITNFNFVISRNTLKSCHEKFNIFFRTLLSWILLVNVVYKQHNHTFQKTSRKWFDFDIWLSTWAWSIEKCYAPWTQAYCDKANNEVLVYNISFLLTLWNINHIEELNWNSESRL